MTTVYIVSVIMMKIALGIVLIAMPMFVIFYWIFAGEDSPVATWILHKKMGWLPSKAERIYRLEIRLDSHYAIMDRLDEENLNLKQDIKMMKIHQAIETTFKTSDGSTDGSSSLDRFSSIETKKE